MSRRKAHMLRASSCCTALLQAVPHERRLAKLLAQFAADATARAADLPPPSHSHMITPGQQPSLSTRPDRLLRALAVQGCPATVYFSRPESALPSSGAGTGDGHHALRRVATARPGDDADAQWRGSFSPRVARLSATSGGAERPQPRRSTGSTAAGGHAGGLPRQRSTQVALPGGGDDDLGGPAERRSASGSGCTSPPSSPRAPLSPRAAHGSGGGSPGQRMRHNVSSASLMTMTAAALTASEVAEEAAFSGEWRQAQARRASPCLLARCDVCPTRRKPTPHITPPLLLPMARRARLASGRCWRCR